MLNPLFRAGLRKVASGSIAAGEMLADTTATNAHVAPVGVDLSAFQTGKYIFAAYNTVGGYGAFGYIMGTAPGGETTTAELVVDPGFAAVTLAAAKSVTGITKANPGVVTFAAGHGYANGDIIYFSGLTQMTELNTQYWQLRANSGDTFQLATVYNTTSLDTSGYGAAETTGGNCAQKTTFTSWTQGTGWRVGVNGAGALTNTAVQISNASQGYFIEQNAAAYDAGKLYKSGFEILTITPGSFILDPSSGINETTTGVKSFYTTKTSGYHVNINARWVLGSIDNVTLKQVLTPSATGALIVSAKDGATRAWAYQHASFNPDLASTYKLYYVGD